MRFVMGRRFAGRRDAAERRRTNGHQGVVLVVVQIIAGALVVPVQTVAGIAHAQLEVAWFVAKLAIDHRRLHDGGE